MHDAKRETPACSVSECANARAQLIAKLVRELRDAEQGAHIEETYKRIANATDGATLTKIANFVRGIVAGEWGRKVAASTVTTFAEHCESWTKGDLRKLYPDHIEPLSEEVAADYKSKLRRLINPRMGALPLNAVTLDEALAVMRELPEDYSPHSRRHVAKIIRRAMGLAVFPCRLIPHNPLPRGFLPKLGKPKARGFIYPNEEAILLAGVPDDADAVPLVFRVLYAFLTREGMRKEEAATLEWSDKRTADARGWIDLERGWVYLDIHKTADDSGARDWRLSPDVVEALARWRKLAARPLSSRSSRFVFPSPFDPKRPINVEHLADELRTHLAAVGIKRPELFEDSDKRKNIVAHDLRGVFVTTALAQGRSEDWIQRRTGHTTSAMLARYRRRAAELGDGESAQLAEMHVAIPELRAATYVAAQGQKAGGADPKNQRRSSSRSAVFTGECEGGDLNPHALSGASTSS